MNTQRFTAKDFTGELFDPHYLVCEGGVRPESKGEPNGLESTKNRRSLGGHGNQYVYVRYPQVAAASLHILRGWTSGPDTLPNAELCLGRCPPRGVCAVVLCPRV